METDYRHNGSIMDEELVRPRMGHVTAWDVKWLSSKSNSFCALQEPVGLMWFLPTHPSWSCVGRTPLLGLLTFALSLSSGGLVPTMATVNPERVAWEEEVPGVCSCLKGLLPKETHTTPAVKDDVLEEKGKLEIKDECILWYSVPWQVDLLPPRALGKDRPGFWAVNPTVFSLVSLVSTAWRRFS